MVGGRRRPLWGTSHLSSDLNNEKVHPGKILGEGIPGEGDSKCKGLKARTRLVRLGIKRRSVWLE